jgi:hypothetical protein
VARPESGIDSTKMQHARDPTGTKRKQIHLRESGRPSYAPKDFVG